MVAPFWWKLSLRAACGRASYICPSLNFFFWSVAKCTPKLVIIEVLEVNNFQGNNMWLGPNGKWQSKDKVVEMRTRKTCRCDIFLSLNAFRPLIWPNLLIAHNRAFNQFNYVQVESLGVRPRGTMSTGDFETFLKTGFFFFRSSAELSWRWRRRKLNDNIGWSVEKGLHLGNN